MADIENNLRFPGQYYDQETGLFYNLNRYYDPSTGRYLRADPFRDGINLYTYCFNNPLEWLDPRGLCGAREVWSTTKYLAYESWDYFWYDWFFEFSDFVAGFGDTISFSGTRGIRRQWNEAFGWEDCVNYHSGNYGIGRYTGYAWFAVTGAAAIEAGALGTIRAGGVAAWMWAKPGLVTVRLLGTNAVLSHPIIAQNISDFVQGFTVPGLPPPSPGGYLGLATREIIDKAFGKSNE